MNKLIAEFKIARIKLLKALDNFQENKREQMLFDKWTLKDLVAHINAWDAHEADIIISLKEGRKPYWVPDVDKFNALTVSARKSWDWQEVYNEFNHNTKKLLNLYETMPIDLWNTRFWQDRRFTPKHTLEKHIEHYLGEHLSKIETIE